jgi:F-type H+-transporting ATPase subunit c
MKKKMIIAASIITIALIFPCISFAQEAMDLKKTDAGVAKTAIIAACIGMAIASGLCGIAQGRTASAACEGMARNPSASGDIRGGLILGLIFIESLALYTLVIIFVFAG